MKLADLKDGDSIVVVKRRVIAAGVQLPYDDMRLVVKVHPFARRSVPLRSCPPVWGASAASCLGWYSASSTHVLERAL